MVLDAQSLPAMYAALLETRNRAADFALAAALPEMENAEREAALEVLLERDHEPAMAELVAGFPAYDQNLRFLLARATNRLGGGVRICIAHEEPEVRCAGIELIGESGSCRLAYLLGEAMSRSCRKTTQLAAQTLLALTERVAVVGQRPARTSVRRVTIGLDGLVSGLRQALLSWPLHYRSEIVEAAALLSDCLEETILTVVADPRRKIAHAFNGVLSHAREPRLVGFALRALRAPELRDAAARLIARATDGAFRDALMAESWLLADPQIAKACARIRALPCIESDPGLVDASNQRARCAVRLLAACGLGQRRKSELLEQLVRTGSRAVARAAGWVMIDRGLGETNEGLKAAAVREDGPLARIAGLEIRRRAGQSFTGGGAMPGADTASWRSGGEAATSRKTFETFWTEYDGLTVADRIEIGRSVLSSTPTFQGMLGERLASAQPSNRIRALRIVSDLELHEQFEMELYHAARDRDVIARSMAMAMLGTMDTVTSRRILREALGDADLRVQANAVESLDRLGGEEGTEDLLAKLESPNNRVRANAVRALMRLRIPEGARELVGMLASDKSANRISALWVVERMGLVSVVERLMSIADTDPDPRVRRRAQRVSQSFAERARAKGPSVETRP